MAASGCYSCSSRRSPRRNTWAARSRTRPRSWPFIEDNWLAGERTGPSSFDNIAGSLNDMFTFNDPNAAKALLNPKTGAVIR